ncbi:MAG: hypothetical protein RL095_545 [Verrucomicrobiota bacterium]|jgi:hypothetical protein
MSLLDLIRAAHKHSNPLVRLEALKQETDPVRLAQLIAAEEDLAVVRKRLEIETDAALLRRLAAQCSGEAASLAAQRAHEIEFKACLDSEEALSAEQLQAFSEKDLLRLAKGAHGRQARLSAASRIHDQDDLVHLAMGEDKDLALVCLSRIDDAHCRKIADGARNKHVRAAAKERLAAAPVTETAKEQDETRRHQRRAEQLIRVVAGMATLPDWSQLGAQLEEQRQQWEEIAAQAEPAQRHRWDEALARAEAAQAAWQVKERERSARAAALREALAQRDEVLAILGSEVLVGDAEAKIEELRREWQGLPALPPDVAPHYDDKFRQAVEKFRQHQKQVARLLADQHRKHQRAADLIAAAAKLEPGRSGLGHAWRRMQQAWVELKVSDEEQLKAWSAVAETLAPALAAEEQQRKEEGGKLSALISALETANPLAAETAALCAEAETLLAAGTQGGQRERLAGCLHRMQSRMKAAAESRAAATFASITAKEELLNEARHLAAQAESNGAAGRARELMDLWKNAGGHKGDGSEPLWEEFRTLCNRIWELSAARSARHKQEKEALIAAAEAIAAGSDWKAGSQTLKEMQERWRHIGFAGKDADEGLRQRFRAVCDGFFARAAAWHDSRRQQLDAVDKRRREIVEKLRPLCERPDPRHSPAVKAMQEDWRRAGPPCLDEALKAEFSALCDSFFSALKSQHEEKVARRSADDQARETLLAAAEAAAEATHWYLSKARFAALGSALSALPPAAPPQETAAQQRYAKARRKADKVLAELSLQQITEAARQLRVALGAEEGDAIALKELCAALEGPGEAARAGMIKEMEQLARRDYQKAGSQPAALDLAAAIQSAIMSNSMPDAPRGEDPLEGARRWCCCAAAWLGGGGDAARDAAFRSLALKAWAKLASALS